MTKLRHDPAFDAAMSIVSAIRLAERVFDPSPEEKREAQRKTERIHNRLESFKTLLNLFEWRYLLTPVGILERRQLYYENEHAIRTTTRQLHIFGFRVARWVVSSTLHRLIPEPPPARLKLRPWRRKGSGNRWT